MARSSENARAEPPARWYQRVVPVCLLVLVVLGIAAAASATVRHQVALSTSREPASYVELYFPPAEGAESRAGCTRQGPRVQVRFVTRSHLQRSQGLAYRVRVDPRGSRGTVRSLAGVVPTSPEKTSTVVRTVQVPRKAAYVVTIVLPGLDQQELRASCPAAP